MTAAPDLILLDTNVLVHLVRGNEFGQAVNKSYGLTERKERPLISVVTVGEMLSLAKKLTWGDEKQAKMLDLVRELVLVDINSEPVLRSYAAIDEYLRQNGRTIGKNDIWIAATVAATSATLLTTDRDFDPLHESFIQRIYVGPP